MYHPRDPTLSQTNTKFIGVNFTERIQTVEGRHFAVAREGQRKQGKFSTVKLVKVKMSNKTAQQKKREQEKFLKAFGELGNVSRAAEATGINRSNHYIWMKDEGSDYPERFNAANERAIDKFEAELIRRGVEGYDKPVFQGGREVGTVREYSDTLLIFLMKGRHPERYGDKWRGEINANVGVKRLEDYLDSTGDNTEA